MCVSNSTVLTTVQPKIQTSKVSKFAPFRKGGEGEENYVQHFHKILWGATVIISNYLFNNMLAY